MLYLDLDGVLHPEDVHWHPKRGVYLGATRVAHTLFEHAPLLVDLLSDFPMVLIVLSTSWVRHRGFAYTVKRLPGALQRRVVGSTYHNRYMQSENWLALPRGAQVLGDVGRRKPRHWVALDDDFDDWPEGHLDKLVKTHPLTGLARPGAVDELRAAFATWCSGPT